MEGVSIDAEEDVGPRKKGIWQLEVSDIGVFGVGHGEKGR